MRRGVRLSLGGAALAVVAAAALSLGAPARATHLENTPNWPGLLPASPGNSAATISPGFDVCPAGAARCPADVILEMYERWRALNATCDHRAVFALTYLRTTEEYFRTIRHQPDFFTDLPWVNHEDAIFAELYFRPADAWEAGGDVPPAWRIAFRSARSDHLTAVGDLMLGMNAHINRDLSFTLAAVGLVDGAGGARKLDHDRVNFFLQRVADPLQAELARRYDPIFEATDGGPSPFDEHAVLETVRGMRENAWRNAERLVNAASEAEREAVAADIERQSTLAAQTIRAQNTVPGYGPTRDAHCERNLESSFHLKVRERRIGAMLDRNELRFRIRADGPARLVLRARLLARRSGAGAATRGRRNRIAQRRSLAISRAGTERTATIKLLPRAHRLLAGRRGARIKLVAREPGSGLKATHRKRLRRG